MSYKETWYGRYYEDFEVGDVYRGPLGRTITEADNVWMTLLTMNTNQSHFNDHYAETTPFGKPIVNSGVTLAIVLGMSVIDTSQKAFANLGWDRIKLTHPVLVGDTLYVESQVLDKRESKSRPYGGIVKVRTPRPQPGGYDGAGVRAIDLHLQADRHPGQGLLAGAGRTHRGIGRLMVRGPWLVPCSP